MPPHPTSLLVGKTPKQCKVRWYEWLPPEDQMVKGVGPQLSVSLVILSVLFMYCYAYWLRATYGLLKKLYFKYKISSLSY